MRIIEVLVSPQGASQIQTKGYAGGECHLASRFLELALGLAQEDIKTAEYYQAEEVNQELQH